MATLKKSKLDLLLKHVADGGDVDEETVGELLGLEPDDTETIGAYIRRATAPSVKSPAPAPQPQDAPTVYQLRGEDGIVRDLEVVRQKGNRTVLALPVVRDLVDILVRGEEVTVDLEYLRKLDPDSLHNEVRVSTLIAAAELAKS